MANQPNGTPKPIEAATAPTVSAETTVREGPPQLDPLDPPQPGPPQPGPPGEPEHGEPGHGEPGYSGALDVSPESSEPSPALESEPSPLMEFEPSPLIEFEPSPLIEFEPSPLIEFEPSPLIEHLTRHGPANDSGEADRPSLASVGLTSPDESVEAGPEMVLFEAQGQPDQATTAPATAGADTSSETSRNDATDGALTGEPEPTVTQADTMSEITAALNPATAQPPISAAAPPSSGSTDNLEVIRKLLQKLEEAATADTGRSDRSLDRNPDRRAGASRGEPPVVKADPPVVKADPPVLKSEPIVVAQLIAQRDDVRHAGSKRELATLQRDQPIARDRTPVALELSQLHNRPLAIPPATAAAVITQRNSAVRRNAPMLAVLSFVLGAASAAGIAFYLEPLKSLQTASTSAASGTVDVAARVPIAPIEPMAPIGSSAPAQATGRASAADTAAVPGSASAEPVAPPSAAVAVAAFQGSASQTAASPSVLATVPATAPPTAPQAAASAQKTLTIPSRIEGRAGDGTPFPLRLQPMPSETDAQLVVVRGVPEWFTLSKGSALGNEIWLIPAHAATSLTFFVADGAEGSVPLKLELAMLDGRVIAQAATTIAALPASISQPYASVPLQSMPDAHVRLVDDAIVRLLARADLLLDTGDLSAARSLYRTAAESGSAGAALKLGETYDPAELRRLGMTMGSADAMAARRWYEVALTLGSLQAADRLTALKQR